MNALTLSLGRNILKHGSREFLRMQSYAKHLDALHIIVLTRKEHGFKEVLHEGNLHIYPTNSTSRFFMLVYAFFLARRIIKNDNPTTYVISAQDPLEIGWVSWLLARVTHSKFHVQVHGDYFSTNAWVGTSLVRRVRRFFALILLQHTPAIRVVSQRIMQSLTQRGIPQDRITVLPIRPELEVFLAKDPVHKEMPDITFLYMGRLAPEKNILRIVKAFTELSKKYSSIKLRIVGDGSERNILTAYIQNNNMTNSIVLSGWEEDASLSMSHADVFLLASLHEAYALTLIEALAVGIPVVTTDVGCVGEVVIDGVHGVVVHDDTIQSYAEGMERMITDSVFRESCGRNGKELGKKLSLQSGDMYAEAWVTSLSKAEHHV